MNIFSVKDLPRLGRRVNGTRRRLGLSREQVATRARVSLEVVEALEGGDPCTIQDFIAIAEVLDVIVLLLWPGDTTDLAEMTYTWRGLKRSEQKKTSRKKVVATGEPRKKRPPKNRKED